MFMFKALSFYRFTRAMDFKTIFLNEDLEKRLKEMKFTPCAYDQVSSMGWVPVLVSDDKQHETFAHQDDGRVTITACTEKKAVPAPLIQRKLYERIELAEKKEIKVTRELRAQFKDEIISELLRQAFPKQEYISICIDTKLNILTVNTASAKKAEDALALLRKTIGSLPVAQVESDSAMSPIIKEWVKGTEHSKSFNLGSNIKLVMPEDEKTKSVYTNFCLQDQEIQDRLDEMTIRTIELDYKSFLFTLNIVKDKCNFAVSGIKETQAEVTLDDVQQENENTSEDTKELTLAEFRDNLLKLNGKLISELATKLFEQFKAETRTNEDIKNEAAISVKVEAMTN